MVDGRHMWRIFDNLMNNVFKYAQSGTRVYLTLEKIDNKAVFSLKNISHYPLDISSEELMERFVRGQIASYRRKWFRIVHCKKFDGTAKWRV